MAKRKDARVTVILECTSCIRNSDKKVSTGISRYITQKNRHNTPDRLELIKLQQQQQQKHTHLLITCGGW